jgi:hypothetical protein
MKPKPKSKQTTDSQKIDRINRRTLATALALGEVVRSTATTSAQVAEMAKNFCELALQNERLIGSNRMLVGHVDRLTREKDTLVKLIGWGEIQRRTAEANTFMADPLSRSAA